MEEDVFNVYKHDHIMLSKALLLRHVHWEHLYNSVRCHSRVLHEPRSFLISIGHRKAFARRVQAGSGIEGLQHPES
jgi:hypothetical protein